MPNAPDYFELLIRAGEDFGAVAVEVGGAPADTLGVEGPYKRERLSQLQGFDEFMAEDEFLPMIEHARDRDAKVVLLLQDSPTHRKVSSPNPRPQWPFV